MTSLGELGYHPAYQPAPGETHYVDNTMTRQYTTAENIAGVVIMATLIAPGAVIGGVGFTGRVLWSLSRRAISRAVFAGPISQYGKVRTLDTYINRADFVYTTYQFMQYRDRFRESPGNSSQVLPAGSARPGGTKGSYHLEGLGLTRRQFDRIEKGAFNPCVEGYVPRKVRGKWMCVPKSSKKSRSR